MGSSVMNHLWGKWRVSPMGVLSEEGGGHRLLDI